MAEKRKRGQNFTADEKKILVKLLVEHKNTILNKKTDGSTNEAKNASWTEVTNSFNASNSNYRSKHSLMKLWEKMKSESKEYYRSTQTSINQTGGRPSLKIIDPILEQVCSIMGRDCTGVVGVQDSNDLTESTNPFEAENVMEMEFQGFKIEIEPNILEATPVIEELKTTACGDEVLNKFPLWSRKRPTSQNNQRAEGVNNLYSSFTDVCKKKENIEDLKIRLLEQELEFKEKLYNLQLRAAKKEVAIKDEILRQLRGGGLTLHNLFGISDKKN